MYSEARTQVLPKRFRLADLCVLLGRETEEQIIRKPPFRSIDILAPETYGKDRRISGLWCENTSGSSITRNASLTFRQRRARPSQGGALKNQWPDIVVPLPEVWPSGRA